MEMDCSPNTEINAAADIVLVLQDVLLSVYLIIKHILIKYCSKHASWFYSYLS